MSVTTPDRREYMRRYNVEHYSRNPDERKQRVRTRSDAIKRWLRELKQTLRCQRCGERHPACLEFHHRTPAEKRFEISTAVAGGYGKQTILAEIAKCEVLCSNCHRKHHAQEFAESRQAFAYD